MKNIETNPRKSPKQKRAVQTIERILHATSMLIEEQGLKGVTTNKIADKANINIATLYQYFPNKDVILVKVLEKALDGFISKLMDLLVGMQAPTLKKALELFMQQALAEFRHSEELFLELETYMRRPAGLRGYNELENKLLEQCKNLMSQISDEIKVSNLDLAFHITVNAGLYIITRHVSDRSGRFSDDEVVDELSDMVVRYLFPE